MKRVSVTLTDDLFAHLEALKLYYGYSTRSEIVEKALDELIGKCAGNIIFQHYLSEVRNNLKEVEE
nr:MAG TPA: putative transcriptional regulator [Caudoviricetes sp.]